MPLTYIEVDIKIPNEFAIDRFKERYTRIGNNLVAPPKDKGKLIFFADKKYLIS
jgi:hypothetical protein